MLIADQIADWRGKWHASARLQAQFRCAEDYVMSAIETRWAGAGGAQRRSLARLIARDDLAAIWGDQVVGWHAQWLASAELQALYSADRYIKQRLAIAWRASPEIGARYDGKLARFRAAAIRMARPLLEQGAQHDLPAGAGHAETDALRCA